MRTFLSFFPVRFNLAEFKEKQVRASVGNASPSGHPSFRTARRDLQGVQMNDAWRLDSTAAGFHAPFSPTRPRWRLS